MARGRPMTLQEFMSITIEILLTIAGTVGRINVPKDKTLQWLREHPDVFRGWLQKLNRRLARESTVSESVSPAARAISDVNNANNAGVESMQGESSTLSRAVTVEEFMVSTIDLLLNVSGKMGIEAPEFETPTWLLRHRPDVLRSWLRKLNTIVAAEGEATNFDASIYSLPPEPTTAADVHE